MIKNIINFINDETKHKYYFIAVAFLLLALYLGLGFVPRSDNHLLSSDSGYYYSYMRSFVMDWDFNIENDIKIYNSKLPSECQAKLSVCYMFSIGPAILWLPFFLAARFLVLIFSLIGINIAIDGYSYVEEWAVGAGSIIYVCIGLYMLYEVLKKYFNNTVSFLSISAFFLATSIFYYTLIEPAMSHSLEFFSICFFLWSLICINKGKSKLICSGISGGLLSVVRWQNSLFLILLFMLFKEMKEETLKEKFKNFMLVILFMFPFIAVQSVFWKAVLGSYFTIPQGGSFLTYSNPHIFEVLFSTNHGLITWTPITLFGIIGIFLLKEGILKYLFLFIFAADLYVCSIAGDWWCGDSFGMRRMIGLFPLLIIGFGAFYDKLTDSNIKKYFSLIIFLLIIWNFLFIIQYRLGYIPRGDYLTINQLIYEKFYLIFKLLKLI